MRSYSLDHSYCATVPSQPAAEELPPFRSAESLSLVCLNTSTTSRQEFDPPQATLETTHAGGRFIDRKAREKNADSSCRTSAGQELKVPAGSIHSD